MSGERAGLEARLLARGVPLEDDRALDVTIAPPASSGEPLAPIEASTPEVTGPSNAEGRGRLDHSLPSVSISFPVGDPPVHEGAPTNDGQLEIVAVLGSGGMGSVYLARERALDREVAIKTTHSPNSAHAGAALCREAVVTGHLEHPGIVPIHQLARATDGRPVLVMRRVSGTNWRQLLADSGHPAWSRMRGRTTAAADRQRFHLDVLGRVSEALAFAHSRGIVHRDVKPENVMIGDFGEVYLVDWGLAVRAGDATADDGLVGTPRYMAPEMVDGGAVDARTDVYLLGATLHEILTGRPPHSGGALGTVLLAAYESVPPAYGSEVPQELGALAARAMSRDPAARPADAGRVLEALREYETHRASRALSRRAALRGAELRERVQRPFGDEDLPALYRLVAECRFGYVEAAREWPENDEVPGGLADCVESAVAIELARRDPRAARALLDELEAPSPLLLERIATLERESQRELAETARIRALAARADAGAQPRARLAVGMLGGGGAVALSVYAVVLDQHAELKSLDLLLFSIGAVVIAGGAVAVRGSELLRHPFNRRLVLWMFATLGGLVTNRLVATLAATRAHLTLQHDLAIMAVCFALGAIWLFPLLGVAAGILLAGALVAAVEPDYALTSFAVTTAAALLVGLVAVHRARRAAIPAEEHALPPRVS